MTKNAKKKPWPWKSIAVKPVVFKAIRKLCNLRGQPSNQVIEWLLKARGVDLGKARRT